MHKEEGTEREERERTHLRERGKRLSTELAHVERGSHRKHRGERNRAPNLDKALSVHLALRARQGAIDNLDEGQVKSQTIHRVGEACDQR